MVRFVVLIALAGCGRVGFTNQTAADDAASDSDVVDVVPLGHDEDGDGVPDSSDVCPHLVDAQADSDGDGVGDSCDPNPAVGGDQIAVFATMMPGDQPLASFGGDGEWNQLEDALQFTGDPAVAGDNNLYGEAFLPISVGSVQIVLALDIKSVIPNTAFEQNQFAIAVEHPAPLYFTELNQITNAFDAAQVTQYDGTNFFQVDSADLATGIHPGVVVLRSTHVVGIGTALEATWLPSESYIAQAAHNAYQGTDKIGIRTNNLHFEILWLVVITSP